MDDLQIFNTMRQVVELTTGLGYVIKADQNKPAPKGSYCSISLARAARQQGQAIIRHSTISSSQHDSLNEDVRAQGVLDVSLNFYRKDAHKHARSVMQANKLSDIQALLFANGIGWKGGSFINDLSALQSGNIEERAQITISIMFEEAIDIEVNSIYGVGVTVSDESDNVLASSDIEISTN